MQMRVKLEFDSQVQWGVLTSVQMNLTTVYCVQVAGGMELGV